MGKRKYKKSFKNISKKKISSDEAKKDNLESEILNDNQEKKKQKSEEKSSGKESEKEAERQNETNEKNKETKKEEDSSEEVHFKDDNLEIKEKTFSQGEVDNKEKFFNKPQGIWKTRDFSNKETALIKNYKERSEENKENNNTSDRKMDNGSGSLENSLENVVPDKTNKDGEKFYNSFESNYGSFKKYDQDTGNSLEEKDIIVPLSKEDFKKREDFFNSMGASFHSNPNIKKESDLEKNYVVDIKMKKTPENELSIMTDKGKDFFYFEKNKKYSIR
ncbi:MAG TPA: hypothetical protein VJ912_02570 [Candidatus Nanoarchaeia archaeon]|nr:hypothetical protein [Candidatus Nanoarchaeia archaeon]